MIDARRNEPETVVELRGVTRRFGATTALDDVSLSVPRGAVFGLVGVNGSGKTTLLKHVLGLLKAQTGQVRVFGLDPVVDPVGVQRTHPTGYELCHGIGAMRLEAGRGGGRIPMRRAGGAGGAAEQVRACGCCSDE